MMNKLMQMLSKPNGCISILKLMAILTFFLWVFVTIYTLIKETTYTHYDTLATVMCIMAMVCLGRKVVESKFLSVKDSENK